MKIEINENGFDEIQAALRQNERIATLALRRTINKVASQTQNHLIRQTAGELTLPRKKIREPFKLNKATQASPKATIEVQRMAVPLMEYRPRQLKRGHSIRVKKDHGNQRLERTFEAIYRGTNRLFQREQDKRGYPIRQMYGPAVPVCCHLANKKNHVFRSNLSMDNQVPWNNRLI